jgi:hypothetical protein
VPRDGYVEVWARVDNPADLFRMRGALAPKLSHVEHDRSLLGLNSFGMGDRRYFRIAFYRIPAPQDDEWDNADRAAPPVHQLDILADLVGAGVSVNSFVLRASLDGPAFCFVNLGMRAKVGKPSAPRRRGD